MDQKNFGILHILAGANPPGEGTGVVVDLQSDKSTFRFEVGEESSFPFKDWYALSEKVPVN